MMNELWTVFNEALVLFVVALIALLAWQARCWLKLNLDASQLKYVSWVASMVVQAAEQYGGDAEEKKRQAVALAQSWLTDHNVFIDLHTLDAAIEAAVFSELNKNQTSAMSLSIHEPGAAQAKPEAAEGAYH
jgi:hypothetical protein